MNFVERFQNKLAFKAIFTLSIVFITLSRFSMEIFNLFVQADAFKSHIGHYYNYLQGYEYWYGGVIFIKLLGVFTWLFMVDKLSLGKSSFMRVLSTLIGFFLIFNDIFLNFIFFKLSAVYVTLVNHGAFSQTLAVLYNILEIVQGELVEELIIPSLLLFVFIFSYFDYRSIGKLKKYISFFYIAVLFFIAFIFRLLPDDNKFYNFILYITYIIYEFSFAWILIYLNENKGELSE